MADITGRFVQLKAISPMLVGQSWETRVAADASGALYASIKGGAYAPIAVGSAVNRMLARSMTVLGSADFGWFFDDFEAQTLNNWSVLGPPVQDLTHGFGVWSCVNTNTFIAFKTAVVAVFNPSVTPWHFGGRMRLATAPGAGEAKGFSFDSGAGNDMIRVGLNGASSTTKFSFAITKAAALQPVALSTISTDATTFHYMEMWFDGTSVWGSVDNETPVLVGTAANLPTIAMFDRWGTHTAAGGTLGAYYDWFYSAAARTAT